MKVKMVKSGQIPQYLWGFLSGKNTKKNGEIIPQFFMFIFFVERKSINGGKSPNVYVYVFSFCGENPLSMEVYSSLGKSPRRKSDGILGDTRGELMFFVPKKNVVFVGL